MVEKIKNFNFFAFLGFGDIPMGKKIFWSIVFYAMLFVNIYMAGAFFLFLAVLYKKRGEEELKSFMEIHGTVAIVAIVFITAALLLVVL